MESFRFQPMVHFNPRSLVGNDDVRGRHWRPSGYISIHVPSWGTTRRWKNMTSEIIFQSTFPRGERHQVSCTLCSPLSYFNPRSLVGNDQKHKYHHDCKDISIHVPSWGTTANFHKYSLFFYAINIIFLLFIIPSLFSLVLFMLLF